MNIFWKNQNLWIHHMPSEAIANIGILYDEFLDEVEKLLKPWYFKTEPIETAFNTYSEYSKSVEKKLRWKTSKDFAIDALINFRTEKTKILDNVLKKYREWVIPAIIELKLWTSIFKDTRGIKIINWTQENTASSILEMIKQKLLQIFKQK